jgi:methylenetetrahydrofolate dehydrogenase (NADP+) / methenyltetrahydrofolate cyclohydrolase
VRGAGVTMAKIIDGKAVAAKQRDKTATHAAAFTNKFGRKPGLAVIQVGEDPASTVYVRNKRRSSAEVGIESFAHDLPATTSEAELLRLVRALNEDDRVDGILIQLPFPKGFDTNRVIDAIDPTKDVDGLHALSAGLLAVGRHGLRPCTPSGCMVLLEDAGIDPAGKRAVVVGRSILVGKPVALMLLEKNATVTIAHSHTPDLPGTVRQADIVVAAVGRANMVKGDWIKPGAVVIDVGINRLPDGRIVGDVDFEGVRQKASYISPVPGGVGPMTVTMLLHNTIESAARSLA